MKRSGDRDTSRCTPPPAVEPRRDETGAIPAPAGAARAQLQAILDSMAQPLIIVDQGGSVSAMNPAAMKLYGFASPDDAYHHLDEFIANLEARDAEGRVFPLDGWPVPRALRGETVQGLEVHFRNRRNGSAWTGIYNATPIRNAAGEVEQAVVVIQDITERTRVEKALRESESRYRSLVESCPDPIVVHRDNGFLYANPAALRMYGVQSLEELEGTHVLDLIHPDDREQAMARIVAVGEGRSLPVRELRFLLRDGEPVFFESWSVAIRFDGRLAIQTFAHDITRRKRALQQVARLNFDLQRRVEELNRIFETAPIGLAIADDPEGRHIRGNPANEQTLGVPSGGELSKSAPRPARYRVEKDGHELLLEELPMQRACRGATVSGQVINIVREDGQRLTLLSSAAPLRDEAGQPRGAVGAFLDITELKEAERALRAQNSIVAGINQIFRDAMDCETAEQLGRVCLDVARRLTESPCGFLGELNAEGRLDGIAMSIPGMMAEADLPSMPANLEVHGIYGRVIRDVAGFFTNDPLHHPDRVGTPDGHPPLTAFLGVPLVHAGEVLGMVAVGNREGGYRDEDLEALEALSQAIVQVIIWGRSERALRASQAQLRTIVDNLTEGLVVADLDGRLLQWNRAVLEMHGFDRPAPSPVPLARLPELFELSTEDGAILHLDEWPLSRILRGEVVRDCELRVRRRDINWQRFFRYGGTLARDAAGKPLLALVTAVDVTERKRAEESLREADRRKDEFLATLAHELRNPLAPIRTGVDVLSKGDPGQETAAEVLEMMRRQVTHLVRLVDDLLDVSRITRGKIELRKERVDLAHVITQAMETSRPLIVASRHTLTVAMPSEPAYVDGDPIRLAQVFSNLLNNAAKYTSEGGQIGVDVMVEASEAVIRVRDTGLGIHSAMLPKVFDLFFQLDRSRGLAQGGLGIGLTLVQRLVEMHGGTVEARSDGLNRGSEFLVRLPLAPPVERRARTGAGEPHARRRAVKGRKILVVDDNEDAARALAMLLRYSGNEVRTALDGPTALEFAVAFGPELILLDLGMPGMDGCEVARRIRQNPELEAVCLVALTGWGQEDDRRRTRDAGFDHHLVKPVDPDELDAVIRKLRPGAAPTSD